MSDDDAVRRTDRLRDAMRLQEQRERERWMERPEHVVQFVREFAAATQPATVLDPFVTTPRLAAAVAAGAPGADITAISRGADAIELGHTLAPQVRWDHGDPMNLLGSEAAQAYDLVLLAPPLGMTMPPGGAAEIEGQRVRTITEYAVLQSIRHLAATGRVLLHCDDASFWRGAEGGGGSLVERCGRIGLHLSGVVSVDRGLAPLSGIATSFALFQRQPSEDLFVARLDGRTTVNALVNNLLARRPDAANYYLGALADASEFRGWTQYSLQRELSNVFGSTPLVALESLGETRTLAIKPGSVLEAKSNTLVIPTIGNGPVLTFYPTYEGKGTYRAIEVELDPDKADVSFIAALLSSNLGKRLRTAASTGTGIPHLTARAAASLRLPLPTLQVQADAVRASVHIDSMHSTLERLRSDLWRQPDQAKRIVERVESAARAAPVRRWLETLPYPLASILQRYVAHRDTRARVDSLKHFFEAAAQFSCAAMLSVFRADTELFDEVQPDLIKAAPPGRKLFERADFGMWLSLGGTLARRVRRLTGEVDRRDQFEAVAEPLGPLMQRLSDKGFWAVLDRARAVRNLKSHGGIESEAELQRQLALLEPLLFEMEQLLGSAFEDLDLVLAEEGSFRRGIYTYKAAKRLRGAPTIFDEFELKVREPLEGDHLTFVARDADISPVVKLIPLVRIGPTPSESRAACYFFESRRGGEASYVSYHYEDEPRLSVRDADIEELADLLA